ncbi:TonB-dependent receptor [Bacteroides sp. 519]|uniref:SusC/RagA family TonB-linked outer membrane protein n=1 Tax=Bacteroides sp. 519 TaxID=2302937 RepID=UPI0013D71DAD|nr:TonB-dependent receptor [Bacteroides sp. 519]NDV57994.1 TonB-dependent receptor [Bacteroides sp. 519]
MKRKPSSGRIIQLLSICCMFFLSITRISAQSTVEVHGQILDATMQEPLIGVSIVEKGTTNGTITNLDGKFSLKVNQGATVVLSYIGYLPIEMEASKVPAVIQMKEDSKTLDEVVVVGYGVQKKAHLTGAVSAVDGKELAARKSASVLASMQGALPGVAVTRTGGRPGGEEASIAIRGISSVNSASALVLIDGVEGNLTTLNPDDVESVSVLKDAAASAIYGARAAAGVVLVTTKKGTAKGKAKVSYNGSFGINLPTYMPERVTAWEEQYLINLSRINASVNAETGVANGGVEYDPERTSWVGNPNYWYRPNGNRWEMLGSENWMAKGLDDYGYTHQHSVSVNGGSEKTQYYLSGGYYGNKGILKYGPDNHDRVNLRMTLNTEFNKYLSADVLVSYEANTTKESAYGSANVLSLLYSNRGRQAIYQPEEDLYFETNPYNGDLHVNPIDVMKNSGLNKSRTEYFTGKFGLKVQNIVKGLTLDLNFSRRASYYAYEANRRKLVYYGKDKLGVRRNTGTGYVTKTKNNAYQDKYEALLNYTYKIDGHSFHALGGASYEQYLKDQITGTARNMLSDDFFSFNFYDNADAANTTLSDLIAPWKMASLFGRIDYNWAERYLIEGVIRYDGSSRLAPGRRWDIFPSVSAGWRVSEEPFFKKTPVANYINNLKLRASWGELGNSSALSSYFPYLGLITSKNSNESSAATMKLLGNPVYWQSIMVSQNLTWEILESKNIGVDMGLLDNRLNLGFEYYWKKNKNMMTDLKVGNIVGVATPYQNTGQLNSWGWEITASWNDKIGEVSYQIGANLHDPKNELVRFEGATVLKAGLNNTVIGYPVNSIFGYQTDGYWSSRQEYLDYKAANPGYQTVKSDNLVTGGDVKYIAQGAADHTVQAGSTLEQPGDIIYLGNTNPRYLFGINLAVQWKGFDLALDFQGVGKRNLLISNEAIMPFQASQNMPWKIHLDYWTVDNPNAFFPRIINQNDMNYQVSDKWVQDGAYIRLKNVQLGYTIPIRRNILENLRVYIAGTDVWEHTNLLSVFDPEVKNDIKRTYYPFFRTWTAGVNITF